MGSPRALIEGSYIGQNYANTNTSGVAWNNKIGSCITSHHLKDGVWEEKGAVVLIFVVRAILFGGGAGRTYSDWSSTGEVEDVFGDVEAQRGVYIE